jgi:GDP-4-dehydro-6-deoxy-D-mannose reductase
VRVLVTGANGFLGRRVVAALGAAGATPIGLALDAGGVDEGVESVTVDVRDRAAIAAAVSRLAPEAIVHLAALSHVGASWQRLADYFAVNFLGTENVLAAAAGRRVLFASSAEVYGAVPESEQPLDEERPLAPRSPYALTKAAGERLARGAGAVTMRLFNLVGAGQSTAFALPSFADQLAAIATGERAPVLRVGSLEMRRDFVPVADAVSATTLLLERGEPGTAYNVATGRASSIAEMLDRLRAVSGVVAAVEIDPSRVRPIDIPLLVGRADRLAALGWRPCGCLEAALGELWAEARAAHGIGA